MAASWYGTKPCQICGVELTTIGLARVRHLRSHVRRGEAVEIPTTPITFLPSANQEEATKKIYSDAVQRFWDKVEFIPFHSCYEWTGKPQFRSGTYKLGEFNAVGLGGSRATQAYKVAWRITNGRWPRPGMSICHHCDNPMCVRPEHLYEGTQQQNMQDAVTRNRVRRGEGVGSARLTDVDVVRMRSMYASGINGKALLREFPMIQKRTVYDVLSGDTWQHLL